MKRRNIFYLLTFALLFLFSDQQLSAQEPPPPPGGHGLDGNQDPRGAPIDGGLGILLGLGAAYGGWKIYKSKKKEEADKKD
ncbi:MAG: hypothetical protein JXA23_05435 [Bacteroidales bacterium]|nr:hypothetical protein [Bacteroidales bacterium]